MKHLASSLFLVLAIAAVGVPAAPVPGYSIQAIRYANSPGLIRGGGRNILFDSGFHREKWFKYFPVTDYLRPDEAVKLAGVKPDEVTDVVISHAHWDHMGGIDLFPKATVWIQKDELRYYTGEAWQTGGQHDGIDPEDVRELVQLNTQGRLRLVDGDNVEIFPGIRAYTGARHTYWPRTIAISTGTSRNIKQAPPFPRQTKPPTSRTRNG